MGKNILKKIFTLWMCFLLLFIIPHLSISANQLRLKQTELDRQFLSSENYDFLILTPDELKDNFNILKNHKDSKGIICRCWNWRESERTKLTENTENAVIVIENVLPDKNEELENALKELKDLIEKYCGGNLKILFLNKENPDIEIL